MRSSAFCIASVILLMAFPPGLLAVNSLDRGIELFEAGDLPAAKESLEGVLEADSENHAALFYLGRIALAEEDLDGAIGRLQQAVKLDGDDSAYRTWLGRAYIAKLQTVSFFERGVLSGRALEHLQKAVELDPSNVEARITLGGYYLSAPPIAGGSKKKAREQAEEVLKHDAVEGNAMLARIHIKDEEYDQAIEKLSACVEAKPDNIEYRYHLGMLYQQLERYENAFEAFEEILAIDPEDRAALYQIGRSAALSGLNTDRGIECLTVYLAKDVKPGYPGYDGAHWRLGMIFEHKGDVATARTEYETAVRLNPDEDRYKESLEALGENRAEQ
jgi:tetratricopeptide (TPR) repeat protein